MVSMFDKRWPISWARSPRQGVMSTLSTTNNGIKPKLLWAGVAVLGAISFGIVALTRGEPVNAAWLVVAAVCIYFIAYRFYALFIANKVFGVDAKRADAGVSAQRRPRLRADQPLRAVRPPFRRHRRRRPAGRPGARRADGLSARHAVDPRRRGVRRRGAGHDRAVPVHPARRPLARRHDPLRAGPGPPAPSPASASC